MDCVTHGGGRTLVLDQAHGMFKPWGTVTGHGTYRIKEGRRVVESGSWKAQRLLLFKSFGLATAEQEREIRRTFGIRLPKGSEGGRLILRVHLSNGHDAIMKIDCLLGKPPRHAKEGVSLSILGDTNFKRVVEFPEAGGTVFIRH